MATKTLSVDEDAYRALVRQRKHQTESFSQIIKRSKCDDGPKRSGALLDRAAGTISEDSLRRLTEAQEDNLPPADKSLDRSSAT